MREISDREFHTLALQLTGWFSEEARSLPWRSSPTPYHVWLSEIMLQQTRVEAVKGYYDRFLKVLPDIASLAEAEDDTLLKLWEGLGYYSRVRNLKKAAGILVGDYGGKLPDSVSELKKLPGIGDYTAGAIASLAYGKRVPCVDGNVLRVMMRILGDSSDIAKEETKNSLQAFLQAAYDRDTEKELDPGKLNQALMELGALVCVPNGAPLCENCPVKDSCLSRLEGLTEVIPVKSPKAARRVEKRTVLLLMDSARTALDKRPGKGLLAGLWEFPNSEGHLSEKEALHFCRGLGFSPLQIESLPPAKHIFTHVEWQMTGYRVRVEEEALASKEDLRKRNEKGIVLVDSGDLRTRLAMPSAFAFYKSLL